MQNWSHRTVRRGFRTIATVGAIAALGLVATVAVASSDSPAASTTTTKTGGYPYVYRGDIKNQQLVLGPQSSPTHVVDTPALPIGTYLVSYSVGVVLGPSDNVVCAAAPKSVGGNDSDFAGAGSGSSTYGSGVNGVYGTASTLDVITTTKAGDQISVTCNANGGKGTYVGGAQIVVTPVGTLVNENQ
jgi:hypothetical protein